MDTSFHSRDSGSYYPSTEVLVSRLARKEEMSRIQDRGVLLPTDTYNDLGRLGSLTINQHVIYNKLNPIAGNTTHERVGNIFKGMEASLQSIEFTMRMSNLLHQDVAGEVLGGICKKKGISDPQRSFSSHAVTAKEKVNIINTDGKTFTLIHEEMVELKSIEDLEYDIHRPTYFKVKTIVTGTVGQLLHNEGNQLHIEAAYTKEHSTLKEAQNDNYFGTAVGGFRNTESYLKG